ncbi:MAG: hypothetical protein A3C22_03305 [Candidatus Levybacteria bacterium RIFCSPHIGHO2_02_FULL_37_10]|nr:MAG: hypothetical protein A3C22_03305 [Candidatus Levybacteria bacterium RIFCSPHIGHO2_02_FULL_37_10]
MLSKNHPIILFIDRKGFSLFQDTLSSFPRFNFTPDIIRNLDVINEGQLTVFIAAFIQINKIIPSSLGIILSDTVTYTKNLDNTFESQENTQNFLENIPFEEVIAKVVRTDQQVRAVAVNKNLVMAIANAFIGKGCVLEAIIPSFLYGPVANFASGLTQGNIQVILENSEIARMGNLLTNQQKVIFPQNPEEEKKDKKPQNLRQYMLIGIFVTLLIILAVVYLNSRVPQAFPIVPDAAPALIHAKITPTPFVAISSDTIKIRIMQSSQQSGIADGINQELMQNGFENILNEISDAIAEKPSIVFSQNVPSDVRSGVVAIVKKVLPDVSALENQDSDSQITISTGKPQIF